MKIHEMSRNLINEPISMAMASYTVRHQVLNSSRLPPICDTLLVFLGVLGVATIFVQFPFLKISLGAVGVGFLIYYGMLKLKEAVKGLKLEEVSDHAITTKQTILASLVFSLLNPHVYLDTVVLIGGYSSQFNFLTERFYFGAGASAFSTIWFFALAYLAALVGRFLNNPKAMRMVSWASGLILIILAVKLGSDVFGWIRQSS